MKNAIVLGGGYIGGRISQELNIPMACQKIYDLSDIEKIIDEHNPKILINCIGHTGEKNVDCCEKKISKTLFANSFIPMMLAEACIRRGVKLVHISSGCIYHYDYDKQPPIYEDVIPNFHDLFYSRSKIYSELALENLSSHYDILILRIRIPLDDRKHPKNILDKLIRYGQVIDIPNSVTYVPDFIKALKHLVRSNAAGLFNVVNRGGLRYPTLMDEYKKRFKGFEYKIIDIKSTGLVRTNLILSTRKLEMSEFPVRDINEVIPECVRRWSKYE